MTSATITNPQAKTTPSLADDMLIIAQTADDDRAIEAFLALTRKAAYCHTDHTPEFASMEARMRRSTSTREAYFAWTQRCYTSGLSTPKIYPPTTTPIVTSSEPPPRATRSTRFRTN